VTILFLESLYRSSYGLLFFILVCRFLEEDFADSGEESDLENDDTPLYPDEMMHPSARLQRSQEPPSGLPSTVEVLTTDDGCLVYLVGTAHFSESSQEDVAKVAIILLFILYFYSKVAIILLFILYF